MRSQAKTKALKDLKISSLSLVSLSWSRI